jgi:hypothetical protein
MLRHLVIFVCAFVFSFTVSADDQPATIDKLARDLDSPAPAREAD